MQLRGQADGQLRITTVRDSYVAQYLKQHVELNTLYRNIEPNLTSSPEEAIEGLRNKYCTSPASSSYSYFALI